MMVGVAGQVWVDGLQEGFRTLREERWSLDVRGQCSGFIRCVWDGETSTLGAGLRSGQRAALLGARDWWSAGLGW